MNAPRLLIAAAGAALILGLGAPAVRAQPTPASRATAPSGASRDPGADRALDPAIYGAMSDLRDRAASDATRQAAADLLIQHPTVPEVRQLLIDSLKGSLSTPGAGACILTSIARRPDASPRLFPLVVDRLETARPDELPRLLEALGSFRTREAARFLLKHAQNPVDEATATAAFTSLARLAARDDIGPDAAAWAAWFHEVSLWSEGQWRMRLLDNLATRADFLSEQRRELSTRLIDTLRRLHLATKPEGRPAFLASLLLDDLIEIKSLGFELVARELAASGPLDGPVGDAAVQLLTHPQAGIRANAAVLVRQLAPEGAGIAVAAALARETDPTAASDLLLAAVRWPSRSVVEPTLTWLESSHAASAAAAAEAAYWLYRAGEINSAQASRILRVLRGTEPGQLSAVECSLLSALGDDRDREVLATLLTSQRATVRQAVAEALLWYPEYEDEIYRAAASDPDIFDIASRTILVHEPTADGFRSLLHLPMPAPELTRAALLRLARALPATDLLDVIGETSDPSLRRSLLVLLTSEDRMLSERSDPAMRAAIFEGAMQLADLYLEQNEADDAFATIESAPEPASEQAANRAAALRCTALMAMGRVEMAENIAAPVEAWIRGLNLARDKPHAPAVLAVIDARFATALSPQQKVAIDAIRKELAAATTAAGDAPNK